MKKLLFLSIPLLFTICAAGQTRLDSMYDVLNARLERIKSNDSSGRLFVHTDKSVYLPNENIWFAAYVLRSSFPLSLHHTLYACLADPVAKKVIASGKFVMEAGHGQGYIFLPDSIAAGDYQLIAFTNTYLQESIPVPFVQSVKVHVPNRFANTALASQTSKPNIVEERSLRVSWYPESGSLINKVKTRVAFQVRYPSGKPYGFTGGSLLEDGKPIASLSANETGAGTFEFIPAEGKTYSIMPRHNGMDTIEQVVPPVLKAGYNITVAEGAIKDTLHFNVQGRPRINTVYVLIHDFKNVYYFEEVSANVPRFAVDVPVDKLPSGLCTITVFDSTSNPVAERTVFADLRNMTNVIITADSAAYHTRSKVKMTIRTLDGKGKGVPALFSLAAVLQKRIDTSVSQDITSFFYLNPYVKNDVPYSMTPGNKNDIELFMLTKCWTRYKWQQTGDAVVRRASKPLGISGNLLFKGKKLTKPVEIIVINKSSINTTLTDENGAFQLPPEITATEPDWKLSLTVNTKDKQNYSFEVFQPEDSVFKTLAGNQPSFKRVLSGEVLQEELPEFTRAKKLDTVFVKSKKVNFDEPTYAFGQKIFQSQRCSDYVCLNNIINCKRHRTGGTQPQDGEQYYIVDDITSRTIPVIYRACKQQQEARMPALLLHKLNGRNYSKEFYASDINDPSIELNSTLQWSGQIKTDENGFAEISFYTNDLVGSFVCNVQGITVMGVLSGRRTFRVYK